MHTLSLHDALPSLIRGKVQKRVHTLTNGELSMRKENGSEGIFRTATGPNRLRIQIDTEQYWKRIAHSLTSFRLVGVVMVDLRAIATGSVARGRLREKA